MASLSLILLQEKRTKVCPELTWALTHPTPLYQHRPANVSEYKISEVTGAPSPGSSPNMDFVRIPKWLLKPNVDGMLGVARLVLACGLYQTAATGTGILQIPKMMGFLNGMLSKALKP